MVRNALFSVDGPSMSGAELVCAVTGVAGALAAYGVPRRRAPRLSLEVRHGKIVAALVMRIGTAHLLTGYLIGFLSAVRGRARRRAIQLAAELFGAMGVGILLALRGESHRWIVSRAECSASLSPSSSTRSCWASARSAPPCRPFGWTWWNSAVGSAAGYT